MKSSILSLLYLSAFHLPIFSADEVGLSDGALTQPAVLSSASGGLTIDLSMVEGAHDTVAATVFNTRLLGGSLPGPTVRVRSGEWLYVNFENDLVEQPGANVAGGNSDFNFPDSTNIHFHGPHVSGERPGDDTTLSIDPGESYQYEVFFPETHIGGTHWMHPHRHGSGTLQIGGGAAMVLIVEDNAGDVPVEVENAEEIILMVQLFDTDTFDTEVVPESRDGLFDLTRADGVLPIFRLVNGQYRPVLDIIAGEWQRWRVVFGSWEKYPLDLVVESGGKCEMNLLAKDGIYITDYPRPINMYRIPTGGRADIMVRCSVAGEYTVIDYEGDLFTLNVVEPPNGAEIDVSIPATEGFVFERPPYLIDLQSRTPATGCSCETKMDKRQMNGMSYDSDVFIHTVALGSVVERKLIGLQDHPYHQHVYPFQLHQFFGTNIKPDDSAYFKLGDYHDSLFIGTSNEVTVRYLPTEYAGRMTVHCHRVDHSDKGMLSAEDIVDGGVCSCSVVSAIEEDEDYGSGFTRAPTTPAPDPKYCSRCQKLHDKASKKNTVKACKKQCIRQQKKKKFSLEPKCNKECCRQLCRVEDALTSCTKRDYCIETESRSIFAI